MFFKYTYLSPFLLPVCLTLGSSAVMAQQGFGVTQFQSISSSLEDIEKSEDKTADDASEILPWQRANFHPPLYPKSMALNGVEGCAVYQTTINEEGDVTDLSVLRSVPDSLNSSELLKSARLIKWQRPPGAEPAQETKEYRINFCLSDSEKRAKERCEAFAALPCQ